MFYGYGLLQSHTPTLQPTAMKRNNSTLYTNLYAVYRAESNANDSLAAYNGTAQGGLTYGAGKNNNAFVFNGTNAYVSLPNNSLNFTGDFSVSLWYYCQLTSNQMTLINSHDYNGSTQSGWVLNVKGSTSEMIFEVYQGGASSKSRYSINFNTSTYNNQWVNVVLTRKASTQTKIYVNGTVVTGTYLNGLATDNPSYGITCNVEIGADYRTGDGLQNICISGAKIDEVYIHNKELTQTEVTTLQTKYYPF